MPNRCSLQQTPATRRPSSGCSRTVSSVEYWRVATERDRMGDELGVLLLRPARPRLGRRHPPGARRCRRSSRCTRTSVSGGCMRRSSSWAWGEDRHPDPLRRPARGRPRLDRERRRGAGAAAGAPAIVVDFGTSTNSTSSHRRGVRRRRPGSRHRGFDGCPVLRAARLFRIDFLDAGDGDRQDDRLGAQSGLVYGFAGQVDEIVTRSGAS